MLKKFILVAFALSCGLFAPTSSYANPSPKPGGPVINSATPAGGVVPKGLFSLSTSYLNADKDKVYVNGSDYDAKNDTTFNLLSFKPRYGLGNGWDIRAAIPFIANDFSAIPSKNGLADSVLVLRKQVLNQDNFPVSVGLGLGAIIPTGSTSYDGLGSGAWGIHSELGVTYNFDGGRQRIEGTLIYQYKGSGESKDQAGIKTDIDYGDLIKAQARYVIAVNKNWDIGAEAQYEHGFESSIRSHGQDNGYTSLFAGPAVTFKYPEWKTTLGVSPQFALYNDYEAANRNGAGPAVETFRIEAKLIKVF